MLHAEVCKAMLGILHLPGNIEPRTSIMPTTNAPFLKIPTMRDLSSRMLASTDSTVYHRPERHVCNPTDETLGWSSRQNWLVSLLPPQDILSTLPLQPPYSAYISTKFVETMATMSDDPRLKAALDRGFNPTAIYEAPLTEIKEPMKTMLQDYSHIPEDKMLAHVSELVLPLAN